MWDAEDFDKAQAAQLIGKSALIGVTFCDAEGNEVKQSQHFGKIKSIDLEDGLVLACSDGSEHVFPPYPAYYPEAEPGIYRLRSTGEEIYNPQVVSTWRVRAPEPHGGAL